MYFLSWRQPSSLPQTRLPLGGEARVTGVRAAPPRSPRQVCPWAEQEEAKRQWQGSEGNPLGPHPDGCSWVDEAKRRQCPDLSPCLPGCLPACPWGSGQGLDGSSPPLSRRRLPLGREARVSE